MAGYAQAQRQLSVTTPLGKDALLLTGFRGHEEVSGLFAFELELKGDRAQRVDFAAVLGQPVGVTLTQAGGGTRHFHGIVSRFQQGGRDREFITYRATLVPQLWLWTQRADCRIFRRLSVPDILKQVLQDLTPAATFKLQGSYPVREYTVQYRESDYAFACRLMEEEGIFFFFEHSASEHRLVLADSPQACPELAGGAVSFDDGLGGARPGPRVLAWEKSQEVRPARFSLGDWCFELPDDAQRVAQALPDAVQAGTVAHALKAKGGPALEWYDYPGDYVRPFDGVTPDAGDQSADLKQIAGRRQQVAKLRAEEAASRAVAAEGSGDVGAFTAGQRFKLQDHFDGDGPYLLTRVEHEARLPATYRASEDREPLQYSNRFTAAPAGVPYRPARVTPRPRIDGVQTATVVGPKGEEIVCDKYGRIKVQFHWDRQAKGDGADSRWVRVSQPWAGGGFGAVNTPRVGHEVVVAFEEGDPDRPLVVGSVYNAKEMPPRPLPASKTQTLFKSRTQFADGDDQYSFLGIEDTKGQEHVQLHSERHMTQSAQHNHYQNVGAASHTTVGAVSTRQVGGLPGINYALTTGSPPGPGGGGGGPGKGRVGRTGGPKRGHVGRLSSGSGGADTAGAQSGPYQQSGPFIGNPPVSGTWAQDLDLVLGWRRCNTLGLYTQTNLGAMWNTTLSIPGWNDLFGTPFPADFLADYPMLGGATSILGVVNAIIGSNTLLHYGPALTIDRGPKLNSTVGLMKTGAATAVRLAASAYALTVVADVLLPLAEPGLKNLMGSAEGAAELLGVAGAAVAATTLTLWNKAEIAFSIFPIVKQAVARETKASILASLGDRWAGALDRIDGIEQWGTETQAFLKQQYPNVPGPFGPGDNDTNEYHVCDSQYSVSAPVIHLASTLDPEDTGPSAVYVEALGNEEIGGNVLVFGSTSAFLGGGAMASVNVETNDAEEGLVTLDCGPDGTITLQSGLAKEPNALTMSPEGISVTSLLKITLQTAESSITIDPEAGITLSVAESSISITPEGITLSCGAASIEMTPAGLVLNAPTITVSGDAETTISTAALAITE
jgi:type VI secretion system secreted protein VgrG